MVKKGWLRLRMNKKFFKTIDQLISNARGTFLTLRILLLLLFLWNSQFTFAYKHIVFKGQFLNLFNVLMMCYKPVNLALLSVLQLLKGKAGTGSNLKARVQDRRNPQILRHTTASIGFFFNTFGSFISLGIYSRCYHRLSHCN